MSKKVIIYGFDSSIRYCMYCEQAKMFLKRKNVEFEFKHIGDTEYDKELMERLGKTQLTGISVPQIFIDDIHVGGFTDLRNKVNSGELEL